MLKRESQLTLKRKLQNVCGCPVVYLILAED